MRALGFIAASIVVILYLIYLLINPYNSEALVPETYVAVLFLILLTCLCAWASLTVKPILMLIVSILSLVPVGAYLLMTPSKYSDKNRLY